MILILPTATELLSDISPAINAQWLASACALCEKPRFSDACVRLCYIPVGLVLSQLLLYIEGQQLMYGTWLIQEPT